MIKTYTQYIVEHDIMMPYGKPLYKGDKITIIGIDVEKDIIKIMKTGDYDRGWYTYLSSFYRYFNKVECKLEDYFYLNQEEYFNE